MFVIAKNLREKTPSTYSSRATTDHGEHTKTTAVGRRAQPKACDAPEAEAMPSYGATPLSSWRRYGCGRDASVASGAHDNRESAGGRRRVRHTRTVLHAQRSLEAETRCASTSCGNPVYERRDFECKRRATNRIQKTEIRQRRVLAQRMRGSQMGSASRKRTKPKTRFPALYAHGHLTRFQSPRYKNGER